MKFRLGIVFTLLLLSSFVSAQISTSDSESASQPPPAEDKIGSTPGTSSLDLTPDARGMLSEEQMRNLLRTTADHDIENDKRQRDYTYIEREEQHNLDGKGHVKSTKVKTSEVLMVYGEQVERLISKDDKPLSAKDAAKEEKKIQKVIDKREHESGNDRKKRLEKEEKEREDGRKFVLEVADAYNFHFLGTEELEGRETYVIDAEPRPGFQPKMKYANILPKFHFRAWIDKDDLQWSKLDATCIDTVSFGLFLARIHKGTRVVVEQTRVNDEVWLPRHLDVKVDARVALLKNFNVDMDTTYRDYKKFRTDTKIVGVGEVQPPDGADPR
jgi:hypothetical protein